MCHSGFTFFGINYFNQILMFKESSKHTKGNRIQAMACE